jgi:hypothetical protein
MKSNYNPNNLEDLARKARTINYSHSSEGINKDIEMPDSILDLYDILAENSKLIPCSHKNIHKYPLLLSFFYVCKDCGKDMG